MSISVETVELPPVTGLGVRAMRGMSELPTFFAEAFHEIEAAARQEGVHMTGPPFARTFSVGPTKVDVEAVFPVDRPVAAGRGRVHPVALPAGHAIQVRHVGSYAAIGPAYNAIDQWISDHHRDRADAPREVYLTDPNADPDPRHWVTLVVQPIT